MLSNGPVTHLCSSFHIGTQHDDATPVHLGRTDGKTMELKAIPFLDEAELESVIVKNPNILRAPGDAHLKTVARRVTLPDAGIIDVLQTDEEGLPIVVEVKLARNGESRREIVAQIFDYVSDLSLMNVDEVDDLVDSKLGNALEDYLSANPPV